MSGVIRQYLSGILGHKNFNLEAANNTPGWMQYKELKWLAKEASEHRRIIEIGCYLGRSTRAMADNTNGVVYAVDNFQGPSEKDGPSMLKNGGLFELFLYYSKDLIEKKKVIPILADHREIEVAFEPDMVFIDGSHQYEDVKADIKLWWNNLLPGGLLCGHDITFDDVKRAVDDTLKYKVARDTTIWYSRK